jgi:cell division protein YceG involved in septum cleavage
VDANFKISQLVTKQLDTFETKVISQLNKKLDNASLLSVVNLASIVEKEERNKQNKPIVA